jgi:ribosome-binding factor A
MVFGLLLQLALLPHHMSHHAARSQSPLMGDRRGDNRRQGRVAQVVRQEMAQVLHAGDIKGKRLASSIRSMISIVDVDVSPDLKNAKIKVSVLGDRKDKISAVRWLQASRGGIRYAMAQRMKEFKRLPEFRFEHVDVGQAVDVMILIDKLASERKSEGVGEEGELDFDADDDEAFAEFEDEYDADLDFDDEDFDEDEDLDLEEEDD